MIILLEYGQVMVYYTNSHHSAQQIHYYYLGKCIAQANGHEREISGVVWGQKSHDSHVFISVSHDQHAHIWTYDGETVKCVYICKGHSRIIESIDISPDGEQVCDWICEFYIVSLLILVLYWWCG